jgi:hypothetical protein
MFADGLLLGSLHFLFRLEPVVELRAGFIAALDVEFIRPSSDAFFEGQGFDRGGFDAGFLYTRSSWHRGHLWR